MNTSTQAIDINILNKQYNSLLWILAEAYVAKCNKTPIKDLITQAGGKYVEGQLYEAHIIALQQLIIEEYKAGNLDLPTEVNQAGQNFEIGVLSEYEKKVLEAKVLNLAAYTSKIKEIKENNPYK